MVLMLMGDQDRISLRQLRVITQRAERIGVDDLPVELHHERPMADERYLQVTGFDHILFKRFPGNGGYCACHQQQCCVNDLHAAPPCL
jgi:hypothetical protein